MLNLHSSDSFFFCAQRNIAAGNYSDINGTFFTTLTSSSGPSDSLVSVFPEMSTVANQRIYNPDIRRSKALSLIQKIYVREIKGQVVHEMDKGYNNNNNNIAFCPKRVGVD